MSAQVAEAQRRGTGLSTLPPTEEERTDAAIREANEQTLEGVAEGDAEATDEQQAEMEQAQENLAEEVDAQDAEDAEMVEDSGAEPMEPAPGIDDLPGDLPPIEQEFSGEEQLPPIEDDLPEIPMDELPDPSTLIPEDIYSPPEAVDYPPDAPIEYDYSTEIAPAPPEVKENAFEKERKMKVRFQQVKLQALKDQAVRDMKDKSEAARTDEDKRVALREYYRMLFAKINSIDPELEPRSAVLEKAYLRRLGQYRVEPTIPMSPPPTPVPLEAL